jgi:hypothetical protein
VLTASAEDPDALSYEWIVGSLALNAPEYQVPQLTLGWEQLRSLGLVSSLPDGATLDVRLRVDDQESPAVFSEPVTVTYHNRPPQNVSVVDATLLEGDLVQLSATATEPGGEPMTYLWNIAGHSIPGGGNGTLATLSLDWNTFRQLVPDADDGNYSISVTASDPHGASTTSPVANLEVVNHAPQLQTISVPEVLVEGGTLELSAPALEHAGAQDPLVYTWTVNGNELDLPGETASSVSLSWDRLVQLGIASLPLEGGAAGFDVSVSVSDDDGGTDASPVRSVVYFNRPPVNVQAGSYHISEGEGLQLDATAQDLAGASLTYRWDLDGNGEYGDVIGPQVLVSWQTLSQFGIDSGPSSGQIGLEVDDAAGGKAYASATLQVQNSAPTVSAGGDYHVTEGESLELEAAGSDLGDDTLTYRWDLNGDSIFGDAVGQTVGVDWTQLQSLGINNGPAAFTVRVAADDGDGGLAVSTPVILHVVNAPPTASATGPYSIHAGQSLSLVATAGDFAADPLTYSWDINGDGVFGDATGPSPVITWDRLRALGLSAAENYAVRVRVADGSSSTTSAPANLAIEADTHVVARYLFYNQSKFDGNTTGIDTSDDGAIALDKSAYLPGSGTATFSNITSYTRGINGIMVDIANAAGPLTVADFTFKISTQLSANNTPGTWEAAPAPVGFSVRVGAGVSGSDRVEIVWANGAIVNRWLEVIFEGDDAVGGFNTNTGLAASDRFYFGNRRGDTGSGTPTLAITNATDEIAARGNHAAGATITNIYDFDRSGIVNATDDLAARNNHGTLTKINLSASPAAPESGDTEGNDASIAAGLMFGDYLSEPLDADSAVAEEVFAVLPRQFLSGSHYTREIALELAIAAAAEQLEQPVVLGDDLLDELLAELVASELR